MERVIDSQLRLLAWKQTDHPYQHGFLKNTLLETTNDWILALDKFLITDVTYVDLKKKHWFCFTFQTATGI